MASTPLPGLYRRTLPSPPAIEFASPEGKVSTTAIAPTLSLSLRLSSLKLTRECCLGMLLQKLLTEALGSGTMEGFFKLISYYQTQSEPAYCGLATLAMVLNALAIDPGRKWKGIYINMYIDIPKTTFRSSNNLNGRGFIFGFNFSFEGADNTEVNG